MYGRFLVDSKLVSYNMRIRWQIRSVFKITFAVHKLILYGKNNHRGIRRSEVLVQPLSLICTSGNKPSRGFIQSSNTFNSKLFNSFDELNENILNSRLAYSFNHFWGLSFKIFKSPAKKSSVLRTFIQSTGSWSSTSDLGEWGWYL